MDAEITLLFKLKQVLFIKIAIRRNVATNQPIRMISEWSCDTEDWRGMAAENSFPFIYINIL